jgi:restriction system protein
MPESTARLCAPIRHKHTTGTFTAEARREASRDGVVPIELIDGEKLVEMFKTFELGLKPVATYEIDKSFVDEFKN